MGLCGEKPRRGDLLGAKGVGWGVDALRKLGDPQPNAGVVELLEKALAEAKAGRLRGLVMVALHVGDETFTYNGGELVPHRALGAIELMKYKILRDRMEW